MILELCQSFKFVIVLFPIDSICWMNFATEVYRGAVEFRRAEVLSLERREGLEDKTLSRSKSLRPLSALKMLGPVQSEDFWLGSDI